MYTIDGMAHLIKAAPDKFQELSERASKEGDYELLVLMENALTKVKYELLVSGDKVARAIARQSKSR